MCQFRINKNCCDTKDKIFMKLRLTGIVVIEQRAARFSGRKCRRAEMGDPGTAKTAPRASR